MNTLGAGPVQAPARGGLHFLLAEARALLAPDVFAIALLALTLGPFVVSILRHAGDAIVLSAMMDDDALISLQLDGMTAWPWGNPANYLGEGGAPARLPPHWHGLSYQGLPYYGGLYLDLAFLAWVPLKLLGLPFFPAGPAILRALAMLFTACTVLAGYNLVRIHFGRLAAVLTASFLATDSLLLVIGTVIHPDSLLFFLCILMLHLCIRHARQGGSASLLALGVVAGLAQGAKMGGPVLVPLTVVALAIGARAVLRTRGWQAWLRRVLRDALMAGALALAVFFLTTPYAFLDPYFVQSWRAWARTFSGPSPISPTTFWDWSRAAWQHLGTPALALAPAGLLAAAFLREGRSRALPLLLAVVLGTTVYLYYALLQKYWVQTQYLIVAFFVLALVATHGTQVALAAAARGRSALAGTLAAALLLAGGTAYFAVRLQNNLLIAFAQIHWKESPQYRVGLWADAQLPHVPRAKIVADAPAYVPPSSFDYAFLGGTVRYHDLAERLPDYFILTRYRGGWQAAKIAGPMPDPWDEAGINVRLYQELLGTNPKEVALDRPGRFATRLASFGWKGDSEVIGDYSCIGTTIACAPYSPAQVAYLYEHARLGVAYSRHVSLFRLDQEAFLKEVPFEQKIAAARPLASSSADDGPVTNVLRGGVPWRSTKQGAAAVGEYVGLELPGRMKVQPRELAIRWVAWHWCPGSIAVDYSDDGRTWTTAATLPVRQPDDVASRMNGTNRWEETFGLPAAGEHRFWRVRAVTMPEGNFFGAERISLR